MKYVKQFAIIMAISLVGAVVERLVPLPIPGNVYGMVLLFILLCFKVVRVDQVKDVADFLIAIMSIFFVPAGVGLITAWPMDSTMLVASLIAVLVLTLVVMGVSGHVTQLVQRLAGSAAKARPETSVTTESATAAGDAMEAGDAHE